MKSPMVAITREKHLLKLEGSFLTIQKVFGRATEACRSARGTGRRFEVIGAPQQLARATHCGRAAVRNSELCTASSHSCTHFEFILQV